MTISMEERQLSVRPVRRPMNGVPRVPEPREWLLTKVCSVCGERKPWALFSPTKYNEDGSVKYVHGRCHSCDVERTNDARRRADYYRRNAERLRAYWRERKRRERARLRAERFGWDRKIPGERLGAFLEAQLKRYETCYEIAAICGCDESTIRRLIKGQQTMVALGKADRYITRLGFHLSEVYSEELLAGLLPGGERV